MTTTKLDLTGLKCPLPALMTRKALKALQPGVVLEVHCTDPLSVIHIPNVIQEVGGKAEIIEGGTARHIPDRKSGWLAGCRHGARAAGSGPIDFLHCNMPEGADIATFCLSTSGWASAPIRLSAGVQRLSWAASIFEPGRDHRAISGRGCNVWRQVLEARNAPCAPRQLCGARIAGTDTRSSNQP